jgi:hypothetical protein
VDIASAPVAGATSTRTFRAIDWGGWAVLLALGAVFVGTGFTVRLALHGAHPIWGDGLLLVALALALTWAVLYYSLRVSAHVVISDEGFALVHGPWRHFIAWREVARLSEWTMLTEGIRYDWIALWSANGGRLQIREDLVGGFGDLRRAILGYLDEPHEAPAVITDLNKPLVMRADPARVVVRWGMLAATGIIGGALLVLFLPTLEIVGFIVLAGGLAAFIAMIATFALRQTVTVSRDGVVAQRGPLRQSLTWSAMYALERAQGSDLRGAFAILGRGIVLLLFRVDRRCVVLPGMERSHSSIIVRGNTGERIVVREELYHHPEWLRARLRAEVAALRAAETPLAAKVQPLPQTGPLSPGTQLPPDPLEASSSTLWMRESMGLDPFNQPS